MAYELTIKRGDLAPDVALQVTDENDQPVDLTGATVQFKMWNSRNPSVLVIDHANGQNVTPLEGRIGYQWQAGDTDQTPGTYEASFLINPVVGDDMHAPTVGNIVIHIEDSPGA